MPRRSNHLQPHAALVLRDLLPDLAHAHIDHEDPRMRIPASTGGLEASFAWLDVLERTLYRIPRQHAA